MEAGPKSTRDPFDDLLGYHLRRASVALMTGMAEALAPRRLKPSEASILAAIEANPAISQSALGRLIGVKRANVGPAIMELIDRKLVIRAQRDGRSLGLTLTPAGLEMHQWAKRQILDYDAVFFQTLDTKDQDQLRSILKRLRLAQIS